MLPNQPNSEKRLSMFSSTHDNQFNDVNHEVRERSFSSTITYRPEMVPKPKPRPSKVYPSPMILSSNPLNLSREQLVSKLTKDSDTSMSFDGDDFSLHIEESDKDSDNMKDMRNMMHTIRARAKSEYFSKDDHDNNPIYTTKHICEEYGQLSSKILVPIPRFPSSTAINIEQGNEEQLALQRKKKYKFSSIIGFLEDTYKTQSMNLPSYDY